jgi:predicted regulator of Ras-like GTPase activity (Roadblock/LC7/MglB family)
MGTLPQLFEEDIQTLDGLLRELLQKTEATTALLIDKGGFLITSAGDTSQFDLTSIAALASGAYMATQTIANLVHETDFNSVYHQGESNSIFALCVDEQCLLTLIFRAGVSVGLVKYYAMPVSRQLALVMKTAAARDPSGGLDLSVLNLADTSSLFKRKTS